jgi:hypothetical protein
VSATLEQKLQSRCEKVNPLTLAPLAFQKRSKQPEIIAHNGRDFSLAGPNCQQLPDAADGGTLSSKVNHSIDIRHPADSPARFGAAETVV